MRLKNRLLMIVMKTVSLSRPSVSSIAEHSWRLRMQDEHSVGLTDAGSQKLSSGHGSDWLTSGQKKPAGHDVGANQPAGQKTPVPLQGAQSFTLPRPTLPLNCPTGHGTALSVCAGQ
jgi:hypothetical protein